jgi:hypothetical protein
MIQEGDLVILKDGDQHRNIWPLGLIEHVFQIHYMNLNTVLRKWSIPVIGVYFSYLFSNMHCLYWVLVKVARAQTNKAGQRVYKQNRLFTCRNRDTLQTCYCLWCTVRLYAIWPLPTRVLAPSDTRGRADQLCWFEPWQLSPVPSITESLTTDHSE